MHTSPTRTDFAPTALAPAALAPPRARLHPRLGVGLLACGLLAGAGVLAHFSGLDQALARMAYDPVIHGFPARDWMLLEVFGHRLAKSVLTGLWLCLLAVAIASGFVQALRPHRQVLWMTAGAMALGPAVIALLKSSTSLACPWDLKAFGGLSDPPSALFVAAARAGRCFPGGHAAGGFSLIALHYAGVATGNARLRSLGLWAALLVGSAFGLVRMAQGAHFLSHNLWAAAVDWLAAALVFAPLLARASRAAPAGVGR